MASPKPETPLLDQCAVIYNNILYVYSPYAFQALPLKKKAKWETLSYGVPVKGAICVKGTDANGDAMLWVVGGSAIRKSDEKFSGLQAYSFAQQKWSVISPEVHVTTNLQGHGAAFLNNSASILVYGGSQNSANLPSTQSFTISVSEPYSVQAYSCDNIPALSPIVLPWDDTSAISVGGSPDNTQIYKFDPTYGWLEYATMLERGLKPPQEEQAVLVQGSDGSKVLELYDFSVSPNTVSHIVLQESDGAPALPGQGIGGKRKRSLTLNNWPPYNGKNAPDVTRSGFSLAQDPDGMVVIAGGNNKHPIEIFNENQNSWINPSSFFGTNNVHKQSVLNKHHSSTTSHSKSTATSSSSPTSTAAPLLNKDHPKTSLILGATLGSILGFIALLVILLLVLRHRRRKTRPKRTSEGPEDEKRMSFADRGASFMKEAGGLTSRPMQGQHDSMMLLGNKEYAVGHMRSETRGSDSSTARLVPKSRGGVTDAMEMETIGEKSSRSSETPAQPAKSNFLQVKPKRSSGWSRYFSGTDMPSMRNSSSRAASTTTTSSSHDCNTHGPTEIPPLNLGQQFTSQRVSRVVTGNTAQPSRDSVLGSGARQDLHRSDTQGSTVPSSRRMRPRTMSSTLSSNPPSTITDTVFTHDMDHQNSTWTPVSHSNWTSDKRDTTTSSMYEASATSDSIPQTPKIVQPSAAATKRGSSAIFYNRASYTYEVMPPQKGSAQTALPIPAGTAMAISTRKVDKPVQSDMSWVNLDPLTTR